MKYGKIIINRSAISIDREYTYIIPEKYEEIIKPGMRVLIPFGKANRLDIGLVVDVLDEYEGEFQLKEIERPIDYNPIIDEELIELANFMREEYIASFYSSLNTVMPPGNFKSLEIYIQLIDKDKKTTNTIKNKIIEYLKIEDIRIDILKGKFSEDIDNYLLEMEKFGIIKRKYKIKSEAKRKTERWVRLKPNKLKLEDKLEIIGNRAKKQIEIIKYMELKKELSLEELLKATNSSNGPVNQLVEKDLLEFFNREIIRDPLTREIPYYKKHKLNSEQESVFNKIIKSKKEVSLIHGVTGSGKTEIYLQLVEEMLKERKDSIILVPEIALTPQTIDRFVGRFKEEVAIIHSGLSTGERFDQWRLIDEGKVKIAIGARSAVFSPFKNLGLIVIDEEHEDTYKSSNNPKYDTRKIAKERIKNKGKLILGSATPSLESYYKALNENYNLYKLEKRVFKQDMPKVDIIDMREELNKGNKSVFSEKLYYAIKENLKNKKQTILFLNRRGYSSFVSCRSCGYIVKCDKCDISMTYHRHINRLKCHYCGETKIYPKICPECTSPYIKDFGIGTEQLEYITKEFFPEARVLRMDGDTMTKKAAYEKSLELMKTGEIDILIGTQMIAKGLDFENITLIGIIAADITLNLPDYRANEKGFQLITQVAGRAGRGKAEGKVILQTYDRENYSIITAKDHDFLSFYNREIKVREAFLYPPIVEMVNIIISSKDNEKAEKTINRIYNLIRRELIWLNEKDKEKFIIKPYPAPLEKIKDRFRWMLILKTEDKYINRIKKIVKEIIYDNKYNLDLKNILINTDVNPTNIL